MSDQFEISRVHKRQQFPGGPNEDPGIRLCQGYLPGKEFAGRLHYVHVEAVIDGQIIPSSVDAVDPTTGRVQQPGEVVIVDTACLPPRFIKSVGYFALEGDNLRYRSGTGL